jgi:beta-galactosidase
MPGFDCFVRLPGWVKGNVWVNGFHLGRYWNLGPQETLYIPGALLARENEIIVFELHSPGPGRVAELLDHPVLDGPIRPECMMLEVE